MSEGWHPDPLRRYAQRYHDGSVWTSHVSNVGGVSLEDPLGVAPSAPGTGLPTYPSGVGHWVPEGGLQRANPFARFLAALIDGIVVLVPILLVLTVAVGEWYTYETDSAGMIDVETFAFHIPMALQIAITLASSAYSILFVGRFGRTPGKMAVGLTIVRADDAAPVSYGAAAIRHVASLIYAIPFAAVQTVLVIASAVLAFVGIGQTLHDYAARTRVVRTSSLPPR